MSYPQPLIRKGDDMSAVLKSASPEVLTALDRLERFFIDGGEITDPSEDMQLLRDYIEHTD